MKVSLHSGSLRHSLQWPVLTALLVLSLGAPARDGGAPGGHGGTHAGAGHVGDRHGGRHFGGRHGGRFHGAGHVFIGLGYWPSWYLPDAYGYGYPLPVTMYTSPVYVEQGDEAQSAYWYYCADSRSYYPYVQQCPSGWLRVVPGPAVQ
ncbi:MAG TPA: hypothetical protein VNS31_11640 [Ramlibacter sp.]|nr:hypothetical protein [Ramlibacter sp.]